MTAIIPLARLRATLPSVDLGDAGVHQVRAITGAGLQLLLQGRKDNNGFVLWEVAQLCLPTAPPEAVLGLEQAEAEHVIAIATGVAEEVLAALGNGSGAAATPSPAPSTPSAS